VKDVLIANNCQKDKCVGCPLIHTGIRQPFVVVCYDQKCLVCSEFVNAGLAGLYNGVYHNHHEKAGIYKPKTKFD
jgi:hypothetical protein